MNDSAKIEWPDVGGCSLMLVARGIAVDASIDLADKLDAICTDYDVGVGHGAELCVDYVRSGVTSLPWLDPYSVFVFRCPRSFSIWEAAPIVDLRASSPDLIEAGLDMYRRCSEVAMRSNKSVAFVFAHDWDEQSRIGYEEGSVDDFLEFLVSSRAWNSLYLSRREYHVIDDYEPFWYEILY